MSIPVLHCPICSSELETGFRQLGDIDGSYIECPYCGRFKIGGTALVDLADKLREKRENRAKLSHAIRQMQESGSIPWIYTNTVDEILKRPLPKPREQADLLLRWICENVPGPGETIYVDYQSVGSLIGALSEEGFALILRHLYDSGLIEGLLEKSKDTSGRGEFTPSFRGWDYYESLRLGRETYRRIFMAMKFGDETLDRIVEEVFTPAVEEAGFLLVRLDDNPQAGLIDDRLRVEIQSCDMIIADLTHDNLGAYWEAGYAEGLGKPVVYTCEAGKFNSDESTHFDTNHHLTVEWDESELDICADRLKATIRATLPHLARLDS